MPPVTSESQILDLCTRATGLANSISVHIVEYISTVKSQTPGIRPLAINFLEVCQKVWPIQSGILDTLNGTENVPRDVLQELEEKIKHTIDSFTSLDLLMTRLLLYERKKGFTKFIGGFGLSSINSEVMSLTRALAKDSEGLRMCSLAFKWILGRSNSSSPNASAYTSLAKALKIPLSTDSPSGLARQRSKQSVQDQSTRETGIEGRPPIPPPQRGWQDRQLDSYGNNTANPSSYAGRRSDPHQPQPSHTLSHPIDEVASLSLSGLHRSTSVSNPNSDFSNDSSPSRLHSSATSLPQVEEALRLESSPRASRSLYRSRDSPITGDAKHELRHEQPHLVGKSALIAAVQQRKHTALEDLLESGISPSEVTEFNLLAQAALNNDIASVRLLLLFGADVDRIDSDGISALLAATEIASLDLAKLLLKHGASPNLCAGPHDESPMAIAARNGLHDLAALYIRYGADCNVLLPSGDTPFMLAINKRASEAFLRFMLASGADVNGKTRAGKTPLFEAVSLRRTDIVSLLLDHGANPNLAGPKHPLWPATYDSTTLRLLISRGAKPGMTPGIMELAASLNNIRSVRILLEAGVDPNSKKDGIYTPLCSAIRDDRADIVSLLLENKADPNIPASEYPAFKCITHNHLHFLEPLVRAGVNLGEPKGILETAVAHNSQEAVMFLIRKDVDVNARTPTGHTPLTTAIRDNRPHMIDVLLAHGADPTLRGEDWPLSMAIKKPQILKRLLRVVAQPGSAVKGIMELAVQANELESVKLLFEAGVNVEDKTGGVFSPLTTAIRENKPDMVRYLVDEAGADVNAPGEHLPLIKAIRRNTDPNHTQVIEFLLERGADINLVYRGWNAVMQAVEKGDPGILKLLIEKGNGIDLQVVDPETGSTVLEYVKHRGWQEGVDMLLENQQQTKMITG